MSPSSPEIQPSALTPRKFSGNALDLLLLDEAQELGLRLERQLAEPVEDQRQAHGLRQAANGAPLGAGVGALLVAEELSRIPARRRRPR